MTKAVLANHQVLVVCLPCYNEDRFIAETIRSLRTQTYGDFAVLISDNCSTDNTSRIVQQACSGDSRFHYYRQTQNIGGSENFNFCRRNSASPLIMWLGAHDLIDPEFLQCHVAAMQANPSLSVSFSDSGWIREDGSLIEVTHGFMDRLPRSPLLRYFLSVRSNDWMNEITNVIRRSALDGFTFGKTWGPDIVGLAHLAYAGPMNRVRGPLYRRRVVEKRDHGYMERLTGEASETVGDGIDYRAFLTAFEEQFLRTAKGHLLARPALALARPWLRWRFGVQSRGAAATMFGAVTRAKNSARNLISSSG